MDGPDKLSLIADALAYSGGTHTVEDVLDQIRSGHMQVIDGERSLIVTEVIDYPRLRALHAFLVAGDMGEILDVLQPRLIELARELRCTRITCAGRFGWTRVLPSHGWCNDCALLRLDIA